MKHLLEFDLEFGLHKVLQDVYMSCSTGEVIGLLGRNGSGKSSLMKIVFGSVKAYLQSVRIDGQHIPAERMHKRLISYLPQEEMLPAFITPRKTLQLFNLDPADFVKSFPGQELILDIKAVQLAEGDKRLVSIYCILRSQALFSILDEPFSFLSPVRNEQVIALIRQESQHKGIIITDHAYRYVLEVCNRSYVLMNGKTWPIRHKDDLVKYGYLLPEG